MKHWQNSWEKIIGKRLRNAESQPQPHLWNLIEHELDQEIYARRSRIAKQITAVAVLFLMLSITYFSTSGPAGDLAILANPSFERISTTTAWHLSDAPTSAGLADLSGAEEATIGAPLKRNVAGEPAETVLTTDVSYPADNIRMDIRGTIEEPERPVAQVIRIAAMESAVPLYNQPAAGTFRPTDKTIRRKGSDLIAIQAGHAMVISPLLVSNASTRLSVLQQYGYLEREANAVLLKAGQWSNGSGMLAYSEDLLVMPERAVNTYAEAEEWIEEAPFSELAENNTDAAADIAKQAAEEDLAVIAEEATETVAMETGAANDLPDPVMDMGQEKAPAIEDIVAMAERTSIAEVKESKAVQKSWVADAKTAFEEWRAAMESEEAVEEEEEPLLIEEAVIDEEDPLTRRQKEEQKLYHALNINKGFHIGLIAGAQHSWVTKGTRNPEVDRSVAQARFSPGYQVGVNLGYDITEHFGIMAELKYSDEGMKYYQPIKQNEEHLDLKYFEIPVYAKVKHSLMTEKLRPIVFNYLIGVKFSDLRSVTTTVNGEERRFGQDYNTSEWGFTAGFDVDFYINKNFFWSNGVRAGVSGATDSFPRFMNQDGSGTMTYDVGIYTRMSFRIPGK